MKKNRSVWVFILLAMVIVSFFIIHAEYKFDTTTNQMEANTPLHIKSGVVFEQELKNISAGTLAAVNIQMGTNGRRNQGEIIVQLLEGDRSICSWNIHSSAVYADAYQTLKVEPEVSINPDASYWLRFSQSYEGENDVFLWSDAQCTDGYTVDGQPSEGGSLCYTLTFRDLAQRRRVILIGIVVFAVVAALVLLRVNEVTVMSLVLLILMSLYMVTCPLGTAPDEDHHFFRAYEIANIRLISQHISATGAGGDYFPKGIQEYTDRSVVLDHDELEPITFVGAALYAPITYLPQVIGIKIAGIFTDNASCIYIGGKIANALCAFLLCIIALKIVPMGRKILFLLMTFPMSIQEMISISADGFTISLSLLFLACVLNFTFGKRKIKPWQLVLLAIASITLSMCKIVYVVLLALLFMIPGKRFNSQRSKWIYAAGILGIAVLLNIVWLKICSGYLTELNPGVNPKGQPIWVLTHVLQYYLVCVRTVLANTLSWSSLMIGSSLGPLKISITTTAWFVMGVLLLYEIFTCQEYDKIASEGICALLLLTFLAGVALVLTSLYVQYTPYQSDYIRGVQGRYFTPLFGLLAYYVVFARQRKLNELGVRVCIYEPATHSLMLILACNGIALLDIMNYYLVR